MARIPDFHTTIWAEISRARAQSELSLNRFVGRYRKPVCDYLVARGLQAADAEDVTQEVFARIFTQDLLAKADREKGRFRWLLLGIARNLAREHARQGEALKRGGGLAQIPLEDLPEAPAEDGEFDRLWVANLIERALEAVQAADRTRGTRYVEVLRLRALEDLPYEALAARFGIGLQDVKNALHRARQRVSAQIRRLVRGYSSSPEEYAEELRFVARYLASGPDP